MSIKRSLAVSKTLPIVAAAFIVVAAAWIFWSRSGGRRGARPAAQEIGPDYEQLIRLKNGAIARLENGDYPACDPAFVELADRLPEDPLGPRNLVIARLLRLEQLDRQRQPAEFDAGAERLAAAVDQMVIRERDHPVAALLAGRAAALLGNRPGAQKSLRRATELAPNDPVVWFELSSFERNSENADDRKEGNRALGEAYRLDPENLSLLVEWLLIQAESHDPPIGLTLASARASLEPLAAKVLQQTRVDVLKLLSDATAAVDDGDWNAVLRNVRILANVIRPDEAAQSDRRRVSRHPLEYALLDFGPTFQQAKPVALRTDSSKFAVTFGPSPADGALPEIAHILALGSADFDLDGKEDVIVLRPGSIEAYGRTGADAAWDALARADVASELAGLLLVDLDGDAENSGAIPDSRAAGSKEQAPKNATSAADADVDVVAFGDAGIIILENVREAPAGTRTLKPANPSEELQALRRVLTVAAADLDHDGDLDLAVSTAGGLSLWSNRGDMTFENISGRAQLPQDTLQVTAIVPVDWDRDVDIDLLIAGQGMPVVGLLENVRHGRFRWRPLETGLSDLRPSALVAMDANADASWDFVVAGQGGSQLVRSAARATGAVELVASEVVSSALESTIAGDVDNDGRLDLIGRGEAGLIVLCGTPAGEFERVNGVTDAIGAPIRDAALADIDGDGDLDLWIATPTRLDWLQNEGGNSNHWINVALKAAQVKGNQRSASGRANHYGVGSLLELKAGPEYQARIVTGQTTHFGLGTRDRADVLRVLWTNGVPHDVLEPRADQTVFELQTLKGSCPYLYTWTGSQFEFWTDLLWAAPIGLQFGEGIIAPAREWEYLKIDGDRLRPRDGRYPLQITEELWEAGYFDQVKLLAVDHPADVEIFSNEKVGPAAIAGFRVHTVRERRIPVAATDRHGRDVLPQIKAEDGVFLKGFDRKLRQGLTEEHYLELDLGKLDSPKRVVLFLTGWVYPTDTSINVALSQNRELPEPKPPALWIPAGGGEWREALPYMGFPGGKTKTIAVDLTGLLAADDYRVRIVTSMEIYWDAAFFSVDEAPASFEVHELPLVSANLHYRGYSARVPDEGNGPEFYDYSRVAVEPRWPPLDGRYTRYGDVLPLVTESDNRLVVLAHGDEMSVEFSATPEKPPTGWTRDFLLYNVGWDKDADLNSVYGQTVEPLPFRSMGQYPFPDGAGPPENPDYYEYLERYQTRESSRQRFWQAIRRFESSGSRMGR